MLKRLVILNSDIYSKADIELDNCNSLQIVGPNNIGKSTLIYALNFLFIIDGREMTFSGNRIGDKTTFNHYFPTINSSFIVFEIFKNRYYTILIKKNAEGNLDYYKIESEYKEEHYFVKTEEGQKLRKFDSILSEFMVENVIHSKFSNRRDVFNFVYQKGKKNNAVVWLNNNVNQDGREISNNFSKIYKYLINSKLINNESLKDSLIIADNKEAEVVSFSKKNQKDIQTLLKHNREIKTIQSIQKQFIEFKELVADFRGKSSILSELVYAFDNQYSASYNTLSASILKLSNESNQIKGELSEKLIPKKNALLQAIGKLENQIEQNDKDLTDIGSQIKEIEGYEEVSFLELSIQNLEPERKSIESKLTQIENQDLSSKELESKIQRTKSEINTLSNKIDNYSTQLIHQITDGQKEKELINQILSSEFTSLSNGLIKTKVKKTSNILTFFDGKIELPDDFVGKEIESLDELKSKLEGLKKDDKANSELLITALDIEKSQKRLSEINTSIKEINVKLEKIKRLPELKTKLQNLDISLKKFIEEKENSSKEVKILDQEISKYNEKLEVLSKDKIKSQNRLEEIQRWKIDVEQLGIKPIEYTTSDSIDNIHQNLFRNYNERREVKQKKDSLFDRLKLKTESLIADETEFIKFIDSELITLHDKQKAIDGLLKNISTQFANPCRTIYSRFEEFNAFITNQFNSKIKKIKISDIDTLKIEIIENEKLISDLKKISDIQDLTAQLIFDDQSENLAILNNYLDNQSTIKFNQLFDIKLHLHKKGQHKVVDLKNQIESDGTDRMIRLVLIMSIINQIVVNDKENKIVLFVDEIGTIDEANRIEIIKFCEEHNFIPISAAPLHPYDGFDKYYLVRRSAGKIIVSEKNGNVIWRKSI